MPADVTKHQVVVFDVGEETYGLDIASVREVIRFHPVTTVPGSGRFVRGVANVRGRILPVVDLHGRLGVPPSEESSETRMLVVDAADTSVGLVVDRVTGVRGIPVDNIQPSFALMSTADTQYVAGVAELGAKIVILLDLDEVLIGVNGLRQVTRPSPSVAPAAAYDSPVADPILQTEPHLAPEPASQTPAGQGSASQTIKASPEATPLPSDGDALPSFDALPILQRPVLHRRAELRRDAAIPPGPDAAAAVDMFYDRILADKALRPYFAGAPIAWLKVQMRVLVAQALGGDKEYHGPTLGNLHAAMAMAIDDETRLARLFVGTLLGLGAPPRMIHKFVGRPRSAQRLREGLVQAPPAVAAVPARRH